MTKNEISSLYVEVDKLLKDICKFLNDEIDGGFMSKDGRQAAENLIERSKKQLQAISVISLDTFDSGTEAYVDMQGSKVNQENEPQDVYSDVSLTFQDISNSANKNEEFLVCPYSNFPATEIKEGKTGYFFRKEKFFIFEQQKKVFAAIQQSWLLIYMNENSAKPCQTYDLTRCEAKPTPSSPKDVKKSDDSFDLISFVDAKSYHFTTQTNKDMLQWVSAINHLASDYKVSSRSLPPLPMEPTMDEILELESSNDYEPLKDYQVSDRHITGFQSNITEKRGQDAVKSETLPLPPRNKQPPPKEVPVVPVQSPSEESLDTYDCVGYSTGSFSEDDSDTHYDNPMELKKSQMPSKNFPNQSSSSDTHEEKDDSDEIYDVLSPQVSSPNAGPPKIEAPPKIVLPEKSKILKSKMLSFNSKRKK